LALGKYLNMNLLTDNGKYYLYRHIRLDTNEVFYVGIGKKPKDYTTIKSEYKRAFNGYDRKALWKNIINKTDYEVEIVFESDDYDFIKQKEIEFIALYGRRDKGLGNLVNHTDGGEGTVGYIRTEEQRKRHSEFMKGKTMAQSTKDKIGKASKGRKPPPPTEAQLAQVREIWKYSILKTSRKIIDIETGEIFNSIKELCKIKNILYQTLMKKLRGTRTNNTPYRYYDEQGHN